MRKYHVYIATNRRNTVLYTGTGITSSLEKRMYEHQKKIHEGFTAKYKVDKLIWCEKFESPEEAIAAEKKIKGWIRSKKIALIKKTNPDYRDLAGSFAPLRGAQDDK